MENRHGIYHSRNTVKQNPLYEEIWQEIHGLGNLGDGVVSYGGNITPNESKIYATSVCEWCDYDFSGQFFIACLRCKNCQYCGNYLTTGIECYACGNRQP